MARRVWNFVARTFTLVGAALLACFIVNFVGQLIESHSAARYLPLALPVLVFGGALIIDIERKFHHNRYPRVAKLRARFRGEVGEPYDVAAVEAMGVAGDDHGH